MSDTDITTLFSRLQNLSLTSSLPATLPDISYYDFLASSSDSQFIYFTRLSRSPSSVTEVEDQTYYVPFFTDNFHTLLHEIANYYELPGGVADIKGVNVKAEGTESDGKFTELELGLDGIREEAKWEQAKKNLVDMGYGNKVPKGGMEMGEGVVVVVEV